MESDLAAQRIKPDHNALGKAAFIIGLIGLILSFVPIIGFVSWLLAPLAIIFGVIALRRPSRSLAIAGIVTGGIALFVCVSWVKGVQSFGEAINADAFNKTGKASDLTSAPIMDASIRQIWIDLEANKIAAGERYGGHRLRFTNEAVEGFGGDAANPTISFAGSEDDYLTELVTASFSSGDSAQIAALRKGSRISFQCNQAREAIGGGYSLADCKLR